jgi:hypothetical protein
MNVINKTIMSIFFVLATVISFAMEERSKPIDMRKTSSDWSSYIGSGLTTGFNCAVSSFDSLTSTVINTVSDTAAFKKLGWPPDDATAQQELERSKTIYKQHNEMFKKYAEYPQYYENYDAINRRAQYCQRVLLALHNDTILNRLDRGKFALHCLQYHSQALNDFQKTEFLYFVKEEQKKIKTETQNIEQELSDLTIVSKTNELLNNLVEQTVKKQQEKK